MHGIQGYWHPHTSSVDFCEENYQFTPFITELYNAITSLLTISLFPLIGLFYSNPTMEKRFTFQYVIMISCGIGSFLLHTTLSSEYQASDELPMLWMTTAFLYTFLDLDASVYQPRTALFRFATWLQPYRPKLPAILIILSIVQTLFYISMQKYYIVFILTYSTMVTAIVLWSWHFSQSSVIVAYLFYRAISSYLILGFSLWLYEMLYCGPELIWFYKNITHGATFHILWHLGAALGTYLEICLLIVVRLQSKKKKCSH